jgi:hypothetical protein
MYYRLEEFYQNHRRYVKDVDAKQLMGDARPRTKIDEDNNCKGLLGPTGSTLPYYPCGLIANSFFSGMNL